MIAFFSITIAKEQILMDDNNKKIKHLQTQRVIFM